MHNSYLEHDPSIIRHDPENDETLSDSNYYHDFRKLAPVVCGNASSAEPVNTSCDSYLSINAILR